MFNSVRKKILSGFLGISLLLGIVSFISHTQIEKINTSYSDLINRRVVIVTHAKDVQNYSTREISYLRAMMLKEDEAFNSVKESVSGLDQTIKEINDKVFLEEHKEMLKKITALNKEFSTKVDQIEGLINSLPESAQQIATEEAIPLAIEIRLMAEELVSAQVENMNNGTEANTKLVESVDRLIIGLSILAILTAIGISLIVSRKISNPMAALSKAAENIATGVLNEDDIKVKNRDEIGKLAQSFNLMKKNLRDLISQVGLNTAQVAATSEQLNAGAEETGKATEQINLAIQEIATGSEKQVSNSIEAAESAEQISIGMNHAARSIRSMAKLTEAANEKANVGNQVVINTVEQMNVLQQSVSGTAVVINELGEKSKEIGQIVNMITDIAKQTNLLSLNAGIEAARAGEHGKGFAVVAGEVRKLAASSNDAAELIQNLIRDVQYKADSAVRSMEEGTTVVDEGMKMVHLTGETFRDIALSVENLRAETQGVSAIVEQVSVSSKGMAEMMESIANTSQQSAANTQNVAASAEEQNASMEEVSAAASALSSMALELQETINRFKV